MALIDIRSFGGLAPSVDPRDLGPERAQIAENLVLRYGDFRPIKGPGSSVATVTSGALALHRTPGGTWLHSTTDADFVNGQINDTAADRVYVTGHAAYPEAWESAAYRRLGVRAPASAPTVAVNVVDEFTREEEEQAVNDLIEDIKAAVLANITETLLANAKPADPGNGAIWLNHGTTTTPALPTSVNTQVCYLTPTTGGVVDLAYDAYLQEPVLNGKLVTYSSQEYWAVPGLWRPVGYTVDEAAVATAIKALLKPPENTEQLVPDATADQIAARIAAIADDSVDPLAMLIDRVNAAQVAVVTFQTRELTDLGRAYALAEQMQRLENAIRTVDEYFVNWETRLAQVLTDYKYLIPPFVDRVLENRVYLYTYVTDWGEESAPSDAALAVELDQNDTVGITVVAPPAVSGYGTTTHWRLYRSSTATDKAYFVAETAIGTLTYTDSKSQEDLGEVCPTFTWTEPRSDMIGLCGGANGIMLGFVGKILCACEPYTPYAWPREYEMALDHKIVGVASTGQSWVVVTEGDTYLVSGADSASLSAQKLPRPQACVSKRSLVGVDGGAIYASPDGLCLADPSGVSVLTLAAADKDYWASLTPATSFAEFSDGVYYLWLTAVETRVTLDFARTSITSSPATGASTAYTSQLTDTMYTVVSGAVTPMGTGSNTTADWRSGIYVFNHQPSFAWACVFGDFTSGSLRIYADGDLILTATVSANTPVRMPAVRAREWEVRFTNDERATRIVLASSSAEIARVTSE